MRDVLSTVFALTGTRRRPCRQTPEWIGRIPCAGTNAWRKYVFSEHNSHGPNLANEYYPTRGVHDGRMHYLRNLTPERRANKSIEEYASSRQGRPPIPWIVADCIPYGVYAGHTDCIQAAIAAKESFPIPYAILQQTIDRPVGELYDLRSDPFDLHNLIDDPRYARKRSELCTALDHWMRETGDPGAALKDVERRVSP